MLARLTIATLVMLALTACVPVKEYPFPKYTCHTVGEHPLWIGGVRNN